MDDGGRHRCHRETPRVGHSNPKETRIDDGSLTCNGAGAPIPHGERIERSRPGPSSASQRPISLATRGRAHHHLAADSLTSGAGWRQAGGMSEGYL